MYKFLIWDTEWKFMFQKIFMILFHFKIMLTDKNTGRVEESKTKKINDMFRIRNI